MKNITDDVVSSKYLEIDIGVVLMFNNLDDNRYLRIAFQELELAQKSAKFYVKILHLNMASCYATLRERAEFPHVGEMKSTTDVGSPSARSKLLLEATMACAFSQDVK